MKRILNVEIREKIKRKKTTKKKQKKTYAIFLRYMEIKKDWTVDNIKECKQEVDEKTLKQIIKLIKKGK